LLLSKALIICTSEAPLTVKRSNDVSVGIETKLRAEWSVVHIAVGAGDFYFLQNVKTVFEDHIASYSMGTDVLSQG
jgi:hypothetical protein